MSFPVADSEGTRLQRRALAVRGVDDVDVVVYDVIGSTQDDVRRLWDSDARGEERPRLVVAHEQTRGRGRVGRSWLSPRGSIAMTLGLPGLSVADLALLPLRAGVAVASTLHRLSPASSAAPELKWPNDVLLDGLKVAGILCESQIFGNQARAAIGIGINVSDEETTELFEATSLAGSGRTCEPTAVVADIVVETLKLVAIEPHVVIAEWKRWAAPWWGRTITFREIATQEVVRGIMEDVDGGGRLVLSLSDGSRRSFTSGEIASLRPQ